MKVVRAILTVVFFGVLLSGIVSSALASAEYAGEPAKHWHDVDNDLMKAFHNPMEGVTMGLDIRLREVMARNIFSANEEYGDAAAKPGSFNNYHWQRYRTRWSLKWALSPDVDFNTRLTWEFWGHCLPERGLNSFMGEQNYDFDEAIFDHFNIQWRNFMDMPLTLTVGRQDIILGTGWLVLDGTPADGSRTIFFDAIRAQYQISDATKLDLIYIQQYDDEEKYIKPFNHHAVQERRHLTQKNDETGFIVYLTHVFCEGKNMDAYYIYKKEEASDWSKDYAPAPGNDAEIHTFGGRLYGNLTENWLYSAEYAAQFGKSHANGGRYQDLCAQGANTKLTYAFLDDMKSEVHVGYEFLSGDQDSTDGKDNQFNPLWGDWPQYQRGGDLQSYIWTFENKGLGNVVNMHRLGFGHSFKPSPVWTIATDYNLLWADETSPRAIGTTANTLTNDNFRGQMLTGLATYQCCKKFKTQFLIDYFIPGNYYDITDEAFFARINMEWTF